MIGRRVVVTGMGMVSPVGHTVAETWENILAGKSGAAPIETFDVSAYNTRFSASVRNFDISAYLAPKESRKMDVFVQYGMAAGIQAMRDSGLEVTEENAPRIGCSIGSGIGGIGQIEKNAEILKQGGPRKISPFFVPGSIINMISGNLSVMYNLQGPSLAIVTACTSGTHNIGLGARLIALGDADAMLVAAPRWLPRRSVWAAFPRRGPCPLAMMIPRRRHVPGTGIGTVSSWVMVPAC